MSTAPVLLPSGQVLLAGNARQQVTIGVPANHFPTPGAGDGLLLAACSDSVVAFAAGAAIIGLGWLWSRRMRRDR
jgi:hypothetical protein